MVLLMMAGCFEATSTTEAQEEQDSLLEMMIMILQMMKMLKTHLIIKILNSILITHR